MLLRRTLSKFACPKQQSFVVMCLGRNPLNSIRSVRLNSPSVTVTSACLLLIVCTSAAVKGNFIIDFSSPLSGLVGTDLICMTAYRIVE